MNRNLAIVAIAIACAVAGNAFADDITIDPDKFTATATRAEVLAELARHRQSGINTWADDHDPLAQFRSSKTRAQVTAEYLAARDAVAAFAGEDSGSSYMARRDSVEPVHMAGDPVNAQ